MLLLSNTSRAPRPLASIAPMARRSRYSRRRAKSTRSSKSTFIRPGAGAIGREGVAMGDLQTSVACNRWHCVQHDSTYVQCGCQEPGQAESRPTRRAAEVAGTFDPGAELGPRLRRVRENRGLSARELARRIS